MLESREVVGSPLMAIVGADEDLIAADEEGRLSAGVVALGRGGAGEVGALSLPDGRLAGLLRLDEAGAWGAGEVAGLLTALPAAACQLVTARRPVALERHEAAWRAIGRRHPERAALATGLVDEYLPLLAHAGWAETRSYLALFARDDQALRRDLAEIGGRLPGHWSACDPDELKVLAGDWFGPLAAGDVTIGWAVGELVAQPQPGWLEALLAEPVLAGLPVVAGLHLGPADVQGPASAALAARRRLALIDARIEARRGAGRRAGPGGTSPDLLAERRALLARLAACDGAAGGEPGARSARLLIACSVVPADARRVWGEGATALRRLGFAVAAIGPARGRELLESCAPVGRPLVGESLLLSAPGAALLAPVSRPSPPVPPAQVPLALCPDGGAIAAPPGRPLLLTGGEGAGKTTAAQTWALARVAAGADLTVVATGGDWAGLAVAGGGRVVPVAGEVEGLLGGLALNGGAGPGQEARLALACALLCDLLPELTEDDHGDLTAALLALVDDHLGGHDVLHLRRLVARLRDTGQTPLALAVSRLAGAARQGIGGPRDTSAAVGRGVLVLDAAPTADRGEFSRAGLAAAGVLAATARLRPWPASADGGPAGRLVVLDEVDMVLAARAGAALLVELVEAIERAGAELWCVVRSPDDLPPSAAWALRRLGPFGLLFGDEPERLQRAAHWLGGREPATRELAGAEPGELLAVPSVGSRMATRARVVPNPLLARLGADSPWVRRGERRAPRQAAGFAVGAG